MESRKRSGLEWEEWEQAGRRQEERSKRKVRIRFRDRIAIVRWRAFARGVPCGKHEDEERNERNTSAVSLVNEEAKAGGD